MKHLDIVLLIFALFIIVLVFSFKNIIAFYIFISWIIVGLIAFFQD